MIYSEVSGTISEILVSRDQIAHGILITKHNIQITHQSIYCELFDMIYFLNCFPLFH